MSSPNRQDASVSSVTLEQLRACLDPSPVPTAILQWNNLLYINSAGALLLGKERAEQIFNDCILGWKEDRGWREGKIDPAESEESRRIRIRSLTERKEQISVPRKSWVRVDGKWVRQEHRPLVVEARAWPIPLAGGSGIQISFPDITQKTRDEQQQQTASEQLALAIDSAYVGIWSYDLTSGKFDCSKACRQICGFGWDEELGYESLFALIHTEDRVRVERTMQQSFDVKGSGKYSCDFRLVRRDGEMRWVASKGRVCFAKINGNPKAVHLYGVILDITDLRQTVASLQQHEKLDVTGRLAASLAHEVNNPLEAVTNLLYLLEHTVLQPEQRQHVRAAQREVERITDITKLTLRFYRDPGRPGKCDLPEIIESVLTRFGGRITGSQVRVERRYGKETSVLGAREELRQVLLNLIQNALDAMPHGGRLLVRTRNARQWPGGRKGVRVSVADTGHGIDPTILSKLFEPFVTSRAAVNVGLGLWLSSQAIRQHGGTIRVKSRQRHTKSGTVFFIFLPLDRRQ